MRFFSLVLVLFSLVPPKGLAEDIEELHTTVDELEVMGSKGDWSEVVFKLNDVPPGARGKRWDALVERAALGHLSTLATEGMSGAGGVATQLLESYPSLRRSKKFLAERNHVGMADFEACFGQSKDGDDCAAGLHQFVRADTSDTAFVLKAAHLAADGHGGGAGLAFVKLALTGQPALCKRKDVTAFLLDGLSLPEGEGRDLAMDLAGTTCWSSLKGTLASKLDTTASPHLADSGCSLIRREPASASKLPKRCH